MSDMDHFGPRRGRYWNQQDGIGDGHASWRVAGANVMLNGLGMRMRSRKIRAGLAA